jgi:hypothetical protein
MSGKKTDWKSKYYEMRSRHINAIDVSFRLGFQEGLKAAELQNMQMQLQQAQQAAAAGMAAGGGMPPEAGGMPPEMGGMPPEAGGMPPEAMGGEMPPEMGGAPEGMMEGAPEEGGEEAPPEEEEPEGDPLDASIAELESLVSKNEKIDFSKMLKSLHKSGSNKKNVSELSEKHKKIDDMIKKWDEKK